jgi:hypothetical protein
MVGTAESNKAGASSPDRSKANGDGGSGRHGLGWTVMILIIFMALVGGFGALIIERMQAVARAADLQAFQRLAISAQSFAGWPGVAEQVGKRSIPIKNSYDQTPATEAIHPQFGRLPLKYYPGSAEGCQDFPSEDSTGHEEEADDQQAVAATATKSDTASAKASTTPETDKKDEAPNNTNIHFGADGLIVWGKSMTYDQQRKELATQAMNVTAEWTNVRVPVLAKGGAGKKPTFLAADPHYVCYHFGPIPYRNILAVPEGFKALLLFRDPVNGGTSRLVAHVGADILPIRDTSDIPDLQRLLHQAASDPKPDTNNASGEAVTSALSAVLGEHRSEFLTPLDVTIAGKAYRLYVYPISFSLGSKTEHMLVVGATATRSTLLAADLNGSRFALFGLLLLTLLAITPMIRIANLGPVDGIKPFELLLIVCSLGLGTAAAATIVFLAGYTISAKRNMDGQLRTQASELASKIGTEIFDISTCPLGAAGDTVALAAGKVQSPPLVFKEVLEADRQPCRESPQWAEFAAGPHIAHPDIVLFMDKDGFPPWRPETGPVPIVSYTKRPGPFYRIADRPYVTRAIDQDVVAGTETLAYNLAQSLHLSSPRSDETVIGGAPPPGSDCNGVRCGIVIQQILSRADGIAKTMVSLPLLPPSPCAPSGRERLLCETKTRVVAVSFVMKSLLAPPLPTGIRYAVVDLSQRPDLPSIFHTDPERANAERFSLSLGASTLAKFERAVRRPAPPCAKRDERTLPGATVFSGSYIGEDQRFAVALAPCTEWAVVTFVPDALNDGDGAFPAEIGFLSWLGLALPFGILVTIGLMVALRYTPARLRMLWPDPLLESAYRRLSLWLTGFILAVLFACAIGVPSVIVLLTIPMACVASVAFLFASSIGPHGESRRREEMREHHRLPGLTPATERAYRTALALWLFTAAALPVGVIAADTRQYQVAWAKAKDDQATFTATRRLERSLALIYASQFAGEKNAPLPRDKPLAPPPPPTIDAGRLDYTAQFLCVLGRGPCPSEGRKAASAGPLPPIGDTVAAQSPLRPFPAAEKAEANDGSYSILFYAVWIVLALLASLLPIAMIRILCRTLFGFGVPLESVRYPRIRPGPDCGLLYSDAPHDNVVWEARYPGSIVAWSERDLEKLRGRKAIDEDRAIVRIHEAECSEEALDRLLESATEYQDQLKQSEAEQIGEELRLQREPREAAYFRILLVRPLAATDVAAAPVDPTEQPERVLQPIGPDSTSPPAWTRFLPRFREEDKPPYDENHAPKRAILVAGPDDFVRRLIAYAGTHRIDLFEESRTKENEEFDVNAIMQRKLPVAVERGAPQPLVIVDNLELLLQDDAARTRVLTLLEKLVSEQKRLATGSSTERERAFRLLMLADMSPLDRFLQATERREAGQTRNLENPTESIRWSRLLEDFTTYTGRVTPRVPAPAEEGALPINASIKYLLRELAYLPDRVVQALLPDHDEVLHESEIQEWGRFLKDAQPAAIADFLASQLIEHYHYLWSISSRAEQILIHRMAAGELPIIRMAYALRSLVRRGIVVLDPAPRLMNDSFARFVGGVERPELLRIWKRDAPQGAWTRIHGNLTIVLPLILLLGGVLIVQGIVGLEAALPLIAAASSALLRPLLTGQRNTA